MARKIDFTQELKDWEGRPIVAEVIQRCEACGQPEETNMLTLRRACLSALGGSYKGEEGLAADKKWERFALGQRISTRDEIELTPSEIKLVSEVINKAFSQPIVVGQVLAMIDANYAIEESEE
jgi:hypothetical protein